MEGLFNNAEQRILEEKRKHWRWDKDELIKQYDALIKKTIVEFYETRQADVDEFISMLNEVKTCMDEARLNVLKTKMEKFKQSLPQVGSKLCLYETEHGTGDQLFPRFWDKEVTQEWLCHWNMPIILNRTTLWNKWGGSGPIPGNTYHADKKAGIHSLEIDQDYKGEDVWIDIPKTLMNCHTWRKRYGLEHLDAICLHY